MEKIEIEEEGMQYLIEARESHKRRVNTMLHIRANNKNLAASLFKAYEPIVNKWLNEMNKLNIKIADSSCKVLYSKESSLKQNEIEENTYSMTVTSKKQDMLHALEKVNICSIPTDDKLEKNSTTVEGLQRYIQCTKFSGKNMTKKISESPHPLKNFRPLKKKRRNPSQIKKKVPVSTLENFVANARKKTPYCKLCYSDSHKISYCSEYPNVASRKARCRELNLCILCSSARHKSKSCLGNFDKSPFQCNQSKTNRHVTPLCEHKSKKDNLATFSTVYTNLILPDPTYNLPIFNVAITKGKETPKFNCSFETGSQRSFL